MRSIPVCVVVLACEVLACEAPAPAPDPPKAAATAASTSAAPKPGEAPKSDEAPKPAPSAAPSSSGRGPATCAQDSDCPRLACGPCKSGDVIDAGPMPNCTFNPCPGATAYCDKGICKVR
jgi:hypothetical protein